MFKAGKWNPDTELVEDEIEKCGKLPVPDFSCCSVRNMRNLHRAVNTNDAALLKSLVKDVHNIPHMMSGWSVDNKETLLSKIVVKNDLALLEALFPVPDNK